jgi:hypothetical protein
VAPSYQTGAHPLRIKPALVFLANGVLVLRPSIEVRSDLGLVPQQIAEYRIHIRQRQAGVLLNDLLGGGALLESFGERVQSHATSDDSHDAIASESQRNAFGLFDDQTHTPSLTNRPRLGKERFGAIFRRFSNAPAT